MADWLARAQLVAAELCSKYKQLDSVMADNEAQEAVMLYELCPKLRRWDFDGWVCHRIWVAHLLRKQKKRRGICSAPVIRRVICQRVHISQKNRSSVSSATCAAV